MHIAIPKPIVPMQTAKRTKSPPTFAKLRRDRPNSGLCYIITNYYYYIIINGNAPTQISCRCKVSGAALIKDFNYGNADVYSYHIMYTVFSVHLNAPLLCSTRTHRNIVYLG